MLFIWSSAPGFGQGKLPRSFCSSSSSSLQNHAALVTRKATNDTTFLAYLRLHEIWQRTMSDQDPFNIQAQKDRNRRWIVKRRRKLARDHHIPGNSASSQASGHKLTSAPPLMHVMKYMVPSVLALVTLKYQGKTESLFLENPAPLWCFVAATCVFWLIAGAMRQMPNLNGKCFKIFSRAALASGVLSTASLVSIFLPCPLSLVPLIMWIPLPVVLSWPIAYSLLLRGITSVINKIHGIVVWARGRNLNEEASLPV